MITRRQRAVRQLGTHLGNMLSLGEWTDEELDNITRVGSGATEQDREYIRRTIRFLQRLTESMQRTLAQREPS